jgi:hypothetical protein
MILVIILNVAVMCMVHADMTEAWQAALSATNVVFTAIFVLEMCFKWIAVSERRAPLTACLCRAGMT